MKDQIHVLNKKDEATVARKIRTQLLRWLGHLTRKSEDSVAKRVFERNPEERRGRGGPKLRWKDSVLEDYQKLGAGEQQLWTERRGRGLLFKRRSSTVL